MPRRIVIHAGFHKTGTSSVQQLLRKNRKALMPALAIRLKGQMKPLIHAARGYSTWRDPLTLAKVAHRFDTLLADLPDMPRRTLVVSGEELSGHMPGRPDIADYSAAPILASTYATAIAARFPQTEIAFLFTTRTRDAWLESAYWEHVKSSSMTLDFDSFAANLANTDLTDTIQSVRAATPFPVHTATFEQNGDPIKTLLDLCDVPPAIRTQLIHTKAANTRLPHNVLLELLAANRAYPDRAQLKSAKQAILARQQAP